MAAPRRVDLDGLVAALAERDGPGRRIVAIAGPPGGGKSTVADALVERLEAARPGEAAVLPMDGYHYDDGVLRARGRRARKGAPDTFDVGGLRQMLARLKRDDEDEVAVPVFDRAIEIARAGARLIPRRRPHDRGRGQLRAARPPALVRAAPVHRPRPCWSTVAEDDAAPPPDRPLARLRPAAGGDRSPRWTATTCRTGASSWPRAPTRTCCCTSRRCEGRARQFLRLARTASLVRDRLRSAVL